MLVKPFTFMLYYCIVRRKEDSIGSFSLEGKRNSDCGF